MKYLTLLALTIVFFHSCARINQESRDRYQAEHKIKHGIVIREKTKTLSKKLDEASVLRGKAIYTAHCLSCHGDKGLGDGPESKKQSHPVANLQKLAKEIPDFTFFMSISQWQGTMPGWKESLSGPEREDLVSYIKSFRLM